MAAHEAPLDRVERAGLVEDRVGDGDLAHVVELGGTGHLVEPLGAHVKLAPDRQSQLADVAEMILEVGAPLGQRAQQDVARLAAGRHAAASLARIHAPVGELKRDASAYPPPRA